MGMIICFTEDYCEVLTKIIKLRVWYTVASWKILVPFPSYFNYLRDLFLCVVVPEFIPMNDKGFYLHPKQMGE
jgi:hypothetical protein